jgi:hypothetical protein
MIEMVIVNRNKPEANKKKTLFLPVKVNGTTKQMKIMNAISVALDPSCTNPAKRGSDNNI